MGPVRPEPRGKDGQKVALGESPVTSNSYNARNVNTDGSLNNNNAYNGNNGVRPASVDTLDLLTAHVRAANTQRHHPRRGLPSAPRTARAVNT